MKVSLVAALDRNRGIGRGNAMPWHLPDDFRHFKALTLGRPILMGRRTAQSLGRALPGRTNLVLTRGTEAPFAGMTVVASLDHAMWFMRPFRADEWLLYDQSSPSACGGRALCEGKLYNAYGEMVASVMQEGLTRYQRDFTPPAR